MARNQSRRARLTNPKLPNLKMNQDVYAMRRNVMEFVYEARDVSPIELPRIDVRVTKNHPATLGSGRIKGNVIWVTENVASKKSYDLRAITFHEILHTVCGVPHDESCPLMKSKIGSKERIPKKVVHARFKYWIKKVGC